MNEPAELVLRDIHGAPLPGFWPPAPGWWLLGLLLVLTLAVLLHALYGYYRRYRQRRRLLGALADLRRTQGKDPRALAAEVSMLLKRIALTRFPAIEVAGLSGSPWLDFLDETGGGEQFRHGPGRVLADAPYAPAAELDVDGLYTLAVLWIKRNA